MRRERRLKSTNEVTVHIEEVNVPIMNAQEEEEVGSESSVDSALRLNHVVSQIRDIDLNVSPQGLSPLLDCSPPTIAENVDGLPIPATMTVDNPNPNPGLLWKHQITQFLISQAAQEAPRAGAAGH